MTVEITILVDSATPPEPVDPQAEEGLSLLLVGPDLTVLFDAGADEAALRAGVERAGVDLGAVDVAVISHGHRDHTGGLPAVVQGRPGLKIYVHAGAFNRRWADRPGRPLLDVSCPHSIERLYQSGAVFHSVTVPERLADWLIVSGPIGGPCPRGGGEFVVRKAGEMVLDTFEDEICLLARGRTGWAVLTACGHRGLRNTLRTACFLARGEPVTTLVGGLHLDRTDRAGLEEAVTVLRRHGIREIYPCHCTGSDAVRHLAAAFPGRVHPLGPGERVAL